MTGWNRRSPCPRKPGGAGLRGRHRADTHLVGHRLMVDKQAPARFHSYDDTRYRSDNWLWRPPCAYGIMWAPCTDGCLSHRLAEPERRVIPGGDFVLTPPESLLALIEERSARDP